MTITKQDINAVLTRLTEAFPQAFVLEQYQPHRPLKVGIFSEIAARCPDLARSDLVTVLSHPSLQGINSGSGISGSTAWHGAFRFRQYLKGVKATDGEDSESDLREFEFKKNQYGPIGESMVLRYQRGLFLPEAGVSDLDKAARTAKAEDVFMELLRRFSGQSRNVSDKATAPNYAPTAFAKEEDAKKHRFKKPQMEQAMRDLFRTNRIRVEDYGRPSRPSYKLVVTSAGEQGQ